MAVQEIFSSDDAKNGPTHVINIKYNFKWKGLCQVLQTKTFHHSNMYTHRVHKWKKDC